jgi:hypothetical protein
MKFNLKIVAATAAVAMMSTGAAQAAASIGVSPLGSYTYSKEGLLLSGTASVTLPDVVITLGNNLSNNDSIFITLPGVVSKTFVPSAGPPPNMECGGAFEAVGWVGLVSGGWQFRIAALGGASLGTTCTIRGLQVEGASLGGTAGVLNYKATRPLTGETVDEASSEESIEVKSQFALTTDQKLNGRINVYDDRLSFLDAETVDPGDGNFEDTLNFTTTETGGFPLLTDFTGPTVDTEEVVATIDGDFAWVDSEELGGDDDGKCEAAEFDAAIAYASWSADSSSTCTQLVWNGTPGDTDHEGYFEVPGDVVLNPVDWVGNIEWTYSLGSKNGKTGQAWDPGVWGINGAQVYIQYMPYGTGIGRIIYAAHTGKIAADVTADIYYDGDVTQCDLGSVAGESVTMLSAVVDTCALAALGSATSGKVAILLTFTAPDTQIEVYSAYNVNNSDRGTVVNSSQGRSFFYGGVPYPIPEDVD